MIRLGNYLTYSLSFKKGDIWHWYFHIYIYIVCVCIYIYIYVHIWPVTLFSNNYYSKFLVLL